MTDIDKLIKESGLSSDEVENMLAEILVTEFANQMKIEKPIGSPRELKLEWTPDAAEDLAKLFSIE